jgi:CRISPR-associated protein Csd1
MGWMTELSAVYDLVIQKPEKDKKPLPLYHIENNAPLIITLNGSGEFKSARLLGKDEKNDWPACMPCTEKSASRTSGVEAYPFCDKLEYVAGDYKNYATGKNIEEKHAKYLALLESWAKSEYSNKKIKAVYSYVNKASLVADILKAGIPEMSDKAKIEEHNVFVRWEVEIPGDNSQTWKDEEIRRLWIQYYSKYCLKKSGFCYISGQNVPVFELHPAKIRNSGDSAKIISSNDEQNYTFRGRFLDADQACQIGAEISVKAHNALRWLIDRQGKTIGNGLTIVSWASSSTAEPKFMSGTHDMLNDDIDDNMEESNDFLYSTAEKFAEALNKKLSGYYGNISNKNKIIVMGLNAATPGRMAILLYREFSESDFCEAQEYWHFHLAWFYSCRNKNDEKPKFFCTISAPSPFKIAQAAYGEHMNDHVEAMAIQRLLPCILDKTPIPQDMEQLCFNRASRLISLDASIREKVLETACAVIKYNSYTRNKEEYTVGLDEERKTRGYLFGRLLAVADRVESKILEERGEKRESNALRYIQRFAKYPSSTWKLLYVDKLHPYLKQLDPKLRNWYEGIIQDILDKFNHEEFVSDAALSSEFLLGYHCQQKDFWRRRDKGQTGNDELAEKAQEE